MTTLHTQALVLRGVDFGESDRILHLLTPRTSRITVIAKGARRSRKRFPGTLDLLNHLRVQIERRRPTSMARLEHARLERTFAVVRRSPTGFALACYLLELLDRLAPEDAGGRDAERLFAFALEALELLDREPADGRLRVLLELRALDRLGLRPQLARCVRCGEAVTAPAPSAAAEGERVRPVRSLGFHVADGGPVCARCEPEGSAPLPVHVGTLRALERSLAFPVVQLGRIALSGAALLEAQTLLARFLRFHVGLELRSARFLADRLGELPPIERPPDPPAERHADGHPDGHPD